MSKTISIIDNDYKQWVKALVVRYRQSQIKAAVKVNTEQLLFNLSLGKDIVERQEENKYGSIIVVPKATFCSQNANSM